ncbi:TPA: hypothetical protein HA239_02220 [Candidatus Woesearchaeota archaeon]|nr:Pyrrolo-quinoline quinone [archaeon GW2011_AR15]MBS3104481.1 hypothetical protein [Candidatus Woesearchaeota archaeon]HIH41205.1 hypothetical protein [Candidatus Woesearchaeota archaeon]
MNKNAIVMLALVMVLVLSACTTYQYNVNQTEEATGEVEINESAGEVIETTPVVEDTGETADITVTEGEVVDLKPAVWDPDDDLVEVSFTSPFDANGEWETEAGDAGFYSSIVTATDNKGSLVTMQVTIRVLPLNTPPTIAAPDVQEFNEGDFIALEVDAVDREGDEVVVTYSGWMRARRYQSTFDDAGEHKVTIKADDGFNIVTKEITVIVKDVNRKPVLSFIGLGGDDSVTATEGDLIEITVEASDPDGDPLTVGFSQPMDANGRWQTKRGDAGEYTVLVTVSDGTTELTKEVSVTVLKKNEAPVIESFTVSPEEVVLKKPGDQVTIKLTLVASDSDGDELTVTYSSYMTSDEKTVTYGEKGGVKTVTVTVSDGEESDTAELSFNMNNWPCFDCQ